MLSFGCAPVSRASVRRLHLIPVEPPPNSVTPRPHRRTAVRRAVDRLRPQPGVVALLDDAPVVHHHDRFAARTVARRCAMTSVVRPHQPLERLLHEPLASASSALVASSSSRIGASRSSARAIATLALPARELPPRRGRCRARLAATEEVLGIGRARRFPDRLLARLPVAVAQVVARAAAQRLPAAPAHAPARRRVGLE